MPPRVLIIDDDPILRELVVEVFRFTGVEVDAAEDGAQGLAAVRRRAADLVLLDAAMPVLDGFATLTAIKNEPGLSHIPVLMLAAFRSETDVRRAKALGAADYVAKPFHSRELLERASRLMAKAQ